MYPTGGAAMKKETIIKEEEEESRSAPKSLEEAVKLANALFDQVHAKTAMERELYRKYGDSKSKSR